MYEAVVIGTSTGGVEALRSLLPALPAGFALPLLVVLHHAANAGDGLARYLDGLAALQVREACGGERLAPGCVYLAPANYHLLVEADRQLALSNEAPVNFARPSVDVLFESASLVFRERLIGIVLTGAARDGALGLQCIKRRGGLTIIQDPDEAAMNAMPLNAAALCPPDRVCRLGELPALLLELAGQAAPC